MNAEDEFEVPELKIVGRFTCLAAPVQAEGTVASNAFYFRARDRAWSFAVALAPTVDPADIAHAGQGFVREGAYGIRRFEASYMPLPEARAIIERCAQEFLYPPPT